MRILTTAIAIALTGAMIHAEDGAGAPPAGGGDAKANGREAFKAAQEKAFTDADKNTDGKLDRSEFEAAVTAINAARAERAKTNNRPAPPAPTKEQLDAAFKAGDANSDSALDKAEFPEAMKALRPKRDKAAGGDKPTEGAAPPAPGGDAPKPPPAP